VSKSVKRKRPFVKHHDTNLNVYGIGAARVERLLHGETDAEKLLRERQEVATAVRKEVRQQQELAKQALRLQQKEEEVMASLRESLEKALAEKEERAARLQATLDDWGDDEPVNMKPTTKESPMQFNDIVTCAPAPTPINSSVSQQTFEHIKANPGITTRQAVMDLAAMGLNAASTTSLISQMVRTGMCKRDNHQLYMMVKYYRPIQMIKKAKSKRDVVRVITRPRPQEDAAVVTAPAPAAGIASLASKPDVTYNLKSLLDNISVNEARALYLELKTMFGGN
jgi:hypothetical protein